MEYFLNFTQGVEWFTQEHDNITIGFKFEVFFTFAILLGCIGTFRGQYSTTREDGLRQMITWGVINRGSVQNQFP